MKRLGRSSVLAWVLLLPLVAAAQSNAGSQMSYETVINGPVSAWADYQMKTGSDAPLSMHYALVDRSASQAMIEVDSSSPEGPVMMLVLFSPSDGRALLAKIKAGGRTEDLPPTALGAARLVRDSDPAEGAETIKVPAGTFQCKRYKHTTPNGELSVWLSDKAYPTGLVKMTGTGGLEMMLLKTGMGATPRFSGDATISKPGKKK